MAASLRDVREAEIQRFLREIALAATAKFLRDAVGSETGVLATWSAGVIETYFVAFIAFRVMFPMMPEAMG